MVTKTRSSTRSKTSPPKTKQKLSLEVVTANQREINGRLYKALELILDHLKGIRLQGGDREKLRLAGLIVDAIPGIDPPGCGAGPYP